MKISIVIPSYNTGDFLEHCLNSIFSQSHKNFEVIIVDGYSTDKSIKIIESYNKQYPNKFHVVYRKPQGQSDAINVGMSLAHGNIVTYICADDTYEPECFNIVSAIFKKYPEVQWLYGKGKIIDSSHKEARKTITEVKEILQRNYGYWSLQCVDYIVQPTMFMRKELYKSIGEFDTNIKYVVDYDYLLRLAKKSKPLFINRYLANWRTHENTFTDKAYKEKAKESFNVSKKYSNSLFRPIQWLVYIVTILIYSK